MKIEAPYEELTKRIIGAAMAVHRELRNGLDERLYENALCIEFAGRAIFFEQQPRFPVSYKNHVIGTLVPDLIVERSVIVDTKVVDGFNDAHASQMIGYLKHTGLQVGLLLNFKHASLTFKRFLSGNQSVESVKSVVSPPLS
jgi:GxxExxY protein